MSDDGDWIRRHGYLPRLERIANELASEWRLELGPRILEGRFSYVAPAGADAILKVVPAEDVDADRIADALSFWDGEGAVRLLRYDAARRALLLERVVPGTDASQVDEDEALAAAVGVGLRIWRKPPDDHSYRTVRDWVRRWLPDPNAHPLAPVAHRTYATMTPHTDTLVHSDFHHHNILRRGAEWVVIDPKPHVGEPEFDVPAFLWNPIGYVSTRERTERRIRAFADAGLDGDRIRLWAIVRGVCDGLPIRPGHGEAERPQLRVARELL